MKLGARMFGFEIFNKLCGWMKINYFNDFQEKFVMK